MNYMSYDDLANCIRRNLWKVPSDVDVVVGIPRSGMIPALMIAELLNRRCADLDAFIEGRVMSYGTRGGLMRSGKSVKIVVIDDVVNSGQSLEKVKAQLAPLAARYDIKYGCVYAESERANGAVDFWLEDISQPVKTAFIKEWNVMHLFRRSMAHSMWDIDGLLCKDPTDDRNVAEYEAYLSNAIPMVIPTNRIGALVTYRLEKYRSVTEAWLMAHGVEYGELMMFPSMDREERNHRLGSAQYKAQIYGNAPWAQLFYESSAKQAETIHRLTGKPVWCYENGKMYGAAMRTM